MKKSKDFKTVVIMLAIVAAIVLAYVARDIYYDYSGAVRTENIFSTVERETVSVEGFVVRDENREVGSILKKQNERVYVPIVSDSASVAKGDSIAVSFDSEGQAEAYQQYLELETKIENFKQLQDQENLSYVNVVALNSEISSAIHNYMKLVDSNKLSEIESAINKINYKITTKQIATGTKMDFNSSIKSYEKDMKALKKSFGKLNKVTTPYAGYFVSTVDGFETAYDYQKIKSEPITSAQVNELLKKKPEAGSGAFGKIIGQHTWYYLCNMSLTTASTLKKGYSVSVSFPDKGLYDISMTVQSVSERAGDTVAVVLKCTLMNRELSTLRREKAEITVHTYSGFKINAQALTTNEEALTGVYVLAGRRVVFKPVIIVYSSNETVIVKPAVYYKDNGEIDTEKTPYLPQIEAFDSVIVKGRNLYDGKVIG